MILKLCAIFAAGLIGDILLARYTLAVANRRPVFAASLSAIITITNLTFLTLIIALMENSGVLPIASFAGGSWLGTYFTVRKS
jgi:hypothetical protein